MNALLPLYWGGAMGLFAIMWSHTCGYSETKGNVFAFALCVGGGVALSIGPEVAAAMCQILISMSVGAAIAFVFIGLLTRVGRFYSLLIAAVLMLVWIASSHDIFTS